MLKEHIKDAKRTSKKSTFTIRVNRKSLDIIEYNAKKLGKSKTRLVEDALRYTFGIIGVFEGEQKDE